MITGVADIKTLRELPFVCAWGKCRENFRGDMPPDWISLITYWSAKPTPVLDFLTFPTERDAVLCPQHHKLLEHSLKRLK